MRTAELLELYKLEKSNLVEPTDDEGTFPSFKDWKSSYQIENQGVFETVSEEEADRRMDQIVDEVEVVLDNVSAVTETSNEHTTTKEQMTMNSTETNASETTPAADAPVASKPKRVRKPAVKAPAKAKSKSELARAIFKRMSRGKNLNREKIIAAFVSEAKLSEKGAATYYQSIKGKGGKKAA